MESSKAAYRKTALITGGSSGIGAACVRCFLRKGWRVSVLDLPDSGLTRLEKFDVLVTPGDVAHQHIREAAVERTLTNYGRIDVLLNNAGVGLYEFPSAVPTPMFSRLLEVNVLAPLALVQRVVPIMKSQGEGTIVNVGSVAGLVSLPWAAAYSASKSALHAIDDALRRELSRDPIHVLKVCPGIVATEFRNHVLDGAAPQEVTRIRWVVSSNLVADRILQGIERRHSTIYVPRIGRLFAIAGTVAPRLMDWYLSRYLPRASISLPRLPENVSTKHWAEAREE